MPLQDTNTLGPTRQLGVLFVTLFMVWCVNKAACDVDMAYCSKYISSGQVSTSAFSLPKFRDNFMVVVERKLVYNYNKSKEVTNTEMYFSQKSSAARLVLDQIDDLYDVYALGPRNTLFMINRDRIDPDCQGKVLTQSRIGQFLMATAEDNNQTVFGPPSAVLQFSKGLQYYNFSKSDVLDDRGIYVNMVKTCTYHAATDATSVADVYFSDPSKTKMPGDPATPVIVRVVVSGVNHHWDPSTAPYNYSISYDYTHYEYGKTPLRDDHFQLDSSSYCKFPNTSNAKPLPQVSDSFRMRLEILSKTKIGGTQEEQKITRNIMTYDRSLMLFVEETIQASTGDDNLVQTERDIMVNDFVAGKQFTVDRIRGECTISVIDKGNVDVVDLHRFVRMKNAKEFFNLDNYRYEYLGVQNIRTIDCDVWRTVYGEDDAGHHTANSIYTLYFATESWKSHFRPLLGSTALPVQMTIDEPLNLETGTGGNFFSYSFFKYEVDVVFQPVPELTNCFVPEDTFNLQFTLKGDLYYLVTPSAPSFRYAIINALVTNGKFQSPSRISRVDYFPWDRKQTLVVFTILDYTGLHGDTQAPVKEPSNADVITNLHTVIDAGQFSVEIQRRVQGQWRKVQTTAVPHTLKVYKPIEGIPTPPTKGCPTQTYTGPPTKPYTGAPTKPYTGPPTKPYTRPPTPKPTGTAPTTHSGSNSDPQGSSSDDSGYGSGDMAGLAIGMIVTSVVLTLLGLFLYTKYRGNPLDSSGIAMSQLTPDP